MPENDLYRNDTYSIVKDMVNAGVPEEHAEIYVSAMVRYQQFNLATKEDIASIERETESIRRDIQELRKETKTEIESLRNEAKVEIEKLRSETKSEFESVRKEIELLKRDLTIRMGGIMVAGIAALSAIKFFS